MFRRQHCNTYWQLCQSWSNNLGHGFGSRSSLRCDYCRKIAISLKMPPIAEMGRTDSANLRYGLVSPTIVFML